MPQINILILGWNGLHIIYTQTSLSFSSWNPKMKNLNFQLLPLHISHHEVVWSTSNVLHYQAKYYLSCAILSLNLLITLFYKALILPGENRCWSLLGCKGLSYQMHSLFLGHVAKQHVALLLCNLQMAMIPSNVNAKKFHHRLNMRLFLMLLKLYFCEKNNNILDVSFVM